MKFLPPLALLFIAPGCLAQTYTLAPTSAPASIGSAHEIDAIPTTISDPASGKAFLFYAKYKNGILLGPSWIIEWTSTTARLNANPQDWDLNADTSGCSGTDIPAGCKWGDGVNGYGNGSGAGLTPSGALMYSFIVTNPNDTLSIGCFYVRSTDHGATWSNPAAFSVNEPQAQYDSPSGQFIPIPPGQATGLCAGGCELKTVRTCNVGCTSETGNHLLFSTNDGVLFDHEIAFPSFGLTDEIAIKWAGGNNLIAFVRPNKTFNPPDALPFFWSTDLGTTWSGTCGNPYNPSGCSSPNQPDALSACASPSTDYDEFTWPHVITTPINSGYMTVMFGERFNCAFGTGPYSWNLRALTFNTSGVLSSQVFAQPQYFYNQNSIVGFGGTGNTTYADFVPTVGNNVTVVMEIPSSDFTCGPSGGIACEQIWTMNAQYRQVQPLTIGGNARFAGSAAIQ